LRFPNKSNAYTVRDVIKKFQRGGIELVTAIDSNHPTSDLEYHRTSIVEEFTQRPPASAKEASACINNCLNRIETDHKNDLATLIQTNFQNFENDKSSALGGRNHSNFSLAKNDRSTLH
jgi:hypothetical protein